MPKLNPDEAAEKWARRTKAAVSDVAAGVARVTENPMEKAKAKKEKALRNYDEALRNGKWEAGLDRVSLSDWQKAMTDIGTGRIASGVDNKGTTKMEDFAKDFYPHLETIQRELEGMPDVSLEDAINRMTHQVRRAADFERSR